MTVNVKVSVNGNYKLPVSYEQGGRKESFEISGRGHSGPNEKQINFSHGLDVMTLQIGPESQDNGEPEAEAED